MGQGILTPIVDKIIGEDADDVSVLGDKTDSLIESGGQLVATAGLQGLGIPWWVTSGVTSFGGGMENSLKEGATYGEATASAGIQAAAEILTEKLFGGSGLGEKGLINLEPLTKGISSKLFKSLADYGIDLFAEGTEEVVSQVASNFGTALYKEDNLADILFSEEAIDGYIESFIGGGVIGGGMNIGNIASSVKNKTDYRSGLTAQEEKVVDKEVENRIAKEEANGNELSKKEKAKIREKVLADLNKGYISIDTIESALGGETYDKYKATVEKEDRLFKEFEELGNKATLKQQTRYKEIGDLVEEYKNNSQRSQLKSQLGKEVFNLVKDSRLAESYNEKSRRGQSFEADLSKYDAKQQEVIKKAVESGILNNTNRTHEFVDMIAKISADKGVLFDFVNNEKLKTSGFAVEGKTVNGYKTDDGNIALNMQSQKALESVVGHEITHILEGTELYSALQEVVKQYATTKGEYSERMQSLRKLYTGVYKGTDFDAKLQAELTADIVGDYLFSDSDFINSLSTEQPNLFKKIYNEIKYLYKVATAGSKEARELEKVKRAFDKAWKESGTAQKNTTNKGDVKYDVNLSFDKNTEITYDSLISKPDMVISEVATSFEDVSQLSRDDVIEKAKEKLSSKKNSKGVITLHNADTGEDIVVGKPGLSHGLRHDYEYTAMVTLNLESYLENAIKINEAVADKNRNHDSDILLGYGETATGERIPAYFVVSKLTTGKSELIEFGSLYSINAKKIAEDSTQGSPGFQSRTSATISISELLDIVNNSYSDILPQSVADHYGIQRRSTKLGGSVKYSLSETDKNYLSAVENGDTTDAHIDLSLSKDGEQPTKNGRFYGKDMLLDLPIREDIAKNATTTFDDIAPTGSKTEKVAPLDDDLPIRKDLAPTKTEEDIAPPVKSSKKKDDKGQQIAKILTKEPETKKKSKLWSKIKTNFIDKASPFETLALKTGNREVDAKYNSIRYSDTKAQLLIGEGADGVKALNDIQAEVENSGLTEALYDYLYHKHNVDRMTLENRYEDIPNKAVFGDSMTAELSQKIVDKYEFENPKLIEYANDVYTYNKHLRNLLVEGGVISQETADLWEEMYPHFVPIRRVDSNGLNVNVPLDSRRTGVNAPIKKATGGNTDILPLFETMAQRTLQTYKAVAKNRFGIELKNTLGTTVAKSETSVDEVIDSIDTQDDLLKEGKYGKNPTFTVFENGEKVTFEITDEMYDAMKPTSEGLAYTNKVANTISNSMRGVLTEYNPTFMLTNAIKDAQDVLINSQHPVKTYKNFPKAVKELASKGEWYTEYIKNGGADNTYFDKQTNTFNKEKCGLSKAIGFPLEKISMANNFIERIPRLAEYIASRESGRSVDVSMLDSARVTTNFSAGGDVTKFLNRNGATFLNASVQGAAQQVRNVREAKANGLKGWVQLATKFALAGLPALFLNGLLWDDDEEYEELSDYVKQNYYVVAKMQDGKFVRIPKGRTMAVIQEAFTQVQNALTGDDEVDLQSFLDLAISNLAPNNPLDNNIIAPIMQVKNNETWYGEDLVPTRLQDVPDAEQYDESTDAISKWLGEKLNYSPYKINYLLNQYSGGLGDMFLPMLTPEAESGDNSLLGNFTAPMKDKFSTDSVFNNQNTTDFYNVSDELMINANSINATDEDVLKNKYFNSISTEIGELYKEKREIQNSDLSDDLKFKQVRDIQKQINEITENALNTYENVTINGSYANIGDKHYRLNDDGEWQKITDEQLEKQNEVIDILGITPSQYWGNKAEYDMKALYPEKYKVLKEQGISVDEYKEKYEEKSFIYTDDFSWASDNPEKYTLSKAITDDVMKYKQYTTDLYNIKADKDSNGKSISGSKKNKKIEYINNLNIDYGAKCILLKSEYPSDDTYNKDIVDYLNGRDDITFEEKKTILEELGATIDDKGYIRW